MTLGERIRSARINMGMTTEELGKAIGVERSAITKYEKGRVTNIPPERIEALAAALDVTPGYLMGWADIPGQMSLWEAAGEKDPDAPKVYEESMKLQSERAKNMRIMNELMNGADDEQMRKLVAMAKLILGKDE